MDWFIKRNAASKQHYNKKYEVKHVSVSLLLMLSQPWLWTLQLYSTATTNKLNIPPTILIINDFIKSAINDYFDNILNKTLSRDMQ